MLAESLLNAPVLLPVHLRCVRNALLPSVLPFAFLQTLVKRLHNFGAMLEPRWIVGTEFLDQ